MKSTCKMRLVRITVLFVLVRPGVGAADWDWVVSGEGDAITRSAAIDAEGNVYVAGEFQTQLALDELTLTGVGSGDAFLVKLSPYGDVIWGRSAGGERLDRCKAVFCDAAGVVVVAGEFLSNSIAFESITLENSFQSPYSDLSFFDVFTTCYDGAGNVLWARKAGGVWHDFVNGIARDGAGGTCVLGTFESGQMGFDTLLVTNTGNVDLYLARYDANGGIQWVAGAVGSNQEAAWSLAIDSADMVYTAGSYRSPVLTIGSHALSNTSDDFDLYVAKWSPGGDALWVRSAAGRGWDDATALAVDRWGGVYVAGFFDSDTLSFGAATLRLSEDGNPNIDMFLSKFDEDGDVIWATASAGAAWTYPQAACVSGAGRVAVAGSFIQPGAAGPERFGSRAISSSGSYDIFLVEYDLGGQPLAAAGYGGPNMDFGADVCSDDDGNLILGGFFSSDSLSIGSVVLQNEYENKMLLAKSSGPASTAAGEDNVGRDAVMRSIRFPCKPNPFSDRTMIEYDVVESGIVSLEIFNIRGRRIRTLVDGSKTVGRYAVVWDGRDAVGNEVASGVYFCRLKTKAQDQLGKVTLVK